jgi:hypothetical protein
LRLGLPVRVVSDAPADRCRRSRRAGIAIGDEQPMALRGGRRGASERSSIVALEEVPMFTNLISIANRLALRSTCAAVVVVASLPAWAHHGWAWAEDGNSELTGVVVAAKLGNPHGELTVDAGGVQWVVEVGQPWRNERAGLKDEMLGKGAKLTVVGHKSADPKQRVFKAERVMIDGKKYDLYPDRD